jgi:hypothetical protein
MIVNTLISCLVSHVIFLTLLCVFFVLIFAKYAAKTLAEIRSAKRYKAMRDELRLQRETSEAELRRLVANRKKALS